MSRSATRAAAAAFLSLADLRAPARRRARPAHLLLQPNDRAVVAPGPARARWLDRLRRTVRTVHVLGDAQLADELAQHLDDVPVFLAVDTPEAMRQAAWWRRDELGANRTARADVDWGYLHGCPT